MKKLSLLLICLIFSSYSSADINIDPLLNKVSLQLQAEQWITTQTALVNVNVSAAVTDQLIVNLQNNIMAKLKSLVAGDWHIVSFNRQQDQSGLESIQIMAQARLPQANLGNLRDKAKAMSKPGETYTIQDVQFTPSDDELRQANIALRNVIYQQAKAELDNLNKTYTDQKFYLHEINFMDIDNPPMAPNMMMMKATYGGAVGAARPQPMPISVGNKVTLHASVVLSAMTAQIPQLSALTTKP